VRAVAALPLVRITGDELRTVDPELESFENLNTPEDWSRAEKKLVGAND
jgi:molybdopterin-guanine dinucleotide biosynthesis protein A